MKKIVSFLLFSTIVCTAVGCGGLGGKPVKKPDFSVLLPPGPPAKAVAVWEPAIRHDGTESPQRGFGGRVYFYDREAKRPVKVDGNVVVYAFDEEGRQPDDNVPSRSYFFDAKDVKKLYSKSKLGPSYNFWIPWDTEGPEGKAKKIALIVRYVPESGSSVVSTQATVYLPGKNGRSEMTAKAEWDASQEEHDAARLIARQLRRKTNPLEARLIETNENRPVSIQTATISIPDHYAPSIEHALKSPASGPRQTAPGEIFPAGYLEEKKATPVAETKKPDRFDRDRFVVGGK